MEQDPNLFTQGPAGQRAMEKILAPNKSDTPSEAADKRRAIQRWYEARRQSVQRRYIQWMNRRSLERKIGTSDVNAMGRYAIDQAVSPEAAPNKRQRRRRVAIAHLWQRLIRRNLRQEPLAGSNLYSRPRAKPWSDQKY